MKIDQGQFPGTEGLKLHYRLWLLPDAADVLIILHGHGEHSGRYEKFAGWLHPQSVAVACYDMRGYGLSEGPRVYVDSFEAFLSDLTCFYEFLKKKFPEKTKFYLLGHSLGGLVATHWVLRHAKKVNALILSSPFLGLRLPGPLIALNTVLNFLAPRFVYQNPVYPPHLTHNPEEIRNYRKDPLIQRKISVRLIHEVLRYQRKLTEMPRIEIPVPVYILAAGLEKVVDLARTRSFFDILESPGKKMKVFEGFYHEIFNELEQKDAFKCLSEYLSDASKSK